jgi:CubicO group peptidase (beta-lactamase class C family)
VSLYSRSADLRRTLSCNATLLALLVCGLWQHCPQNTSTQKLDFIQSGKYMGVYWPTHGWRCCQPEEVGMDSETLTAVYEYAANPELNTEGIIIIKDGYIVAEAYLNGFEQNDLHESFSVAKSFSGALIGIVLDKGLIQTVDQPVYTYFSSWQQPGTPAIKKRITVKHLLTMTTGLEWDEEDYFDNTQTNDAFRMGGTYNYIQYVLNKPAVTEPGSVFNYSSGVSMLLSGIVQHTCSQSAAQFAQNFLFDPMGIENIYWESDPAGYTIGGWGIHATVRDYAKFGYLYLNAGRWEEAQLVSADWVHDSTQPVNGLVEYYGYQWWFPAAFANYTAYDIPDDTFIAVGLYIQRIYVVPSHNLVIVRVGNDGGNQDKPWHTLKFLELILQAIKSE